MLPTDPSASAPIGTPEIAVDDFSRRFALRAENLMWLLGAGASASAGIPTAYDMIWDFKQRLFVSQRRMSSKSVADLSSSAIRAQIQAHIDSLGTLPGAGSLSEYAELFEAAYPAETDRGAYIEAKLAGAKPSFGHVALATLMKAGLVRIAWTTNFDPLVADACAKVYGGTGQLTTGSLDAPDLAIQRITEGRWPIEVKLHGDFRSRKLKNTGDELRTQDARLRRLLVDCCHRYGLVVVGYSGRDVSIIEALDEAISEKKERSFPSGLFWLHRGEDLPIPRVADLLKRASEVGIEAKIVRIQSFDEVMRDLMRLVTIADTSALDAFGNARSRRSGAPFPSGRTGWPVVRLDALPILRMPTVCRKVVCDVGGHKDAAAAVQNSGVDVLVGRVKAGVLAFGSDSAVRTAFGSRSISEFDLYQFDSKRLRFESAERGLLRLALSRAIARSRDLQVIRRRNADLFAPLQPDAHRWAPLKQLVGTLSGEVEGVPGLRWREGVSTRLEWADERLWLLFEPRIVFDGITDETRDAANDFSRERTVKRYNRTLNDLLGFWASVLSGEEADFRALCISDGIDAVFAVSGDTGYSRRAGA